MKLQKKFCLSFFLFNLVLLYYTSLAQTDGDLVWVEQAGGTSHDGGRAVDVLSDGSILITGLFEGPATFGSAVTLTSVGGFDIFIAKYNPDRTILWAKRAGGSSGDDAGYGIDTLPDGSAYITGFFTGTADFDSISLIAGGGTDMFVAKYNPDGTVAWARKVGDGNAEHGTGVAALPDGGVLVTGKYPGFYIAKFDTNGTMIWSSGSTGGVNDVGNGIVALADGSSLITGAFEGSSTFGGSIVLDSGAGNLYHMFLTKYDPDGTIVWAISQGDKTDVRGLAITALPDGSALVTGTFQGGNGTKFGSIEKNANGGSDIFVAKYSPSGTVIWVKQAGGIDPDTGDYGSGIVALPDNSLLVTGTYQGDAPFGSGITLVATGSHDIFLAKYEADGTIAWARRAGGAGIDNGSGVALDSQQGIYVTGAFTPNAVFWTW